MKAVSLAALRYGLVSLFCALLYNLVMIVGDRLGAHYVLSYAIAFVLVDIAGFLLHAHFSMKVAASWGSFGRYTSAMAINAPLNLILIALFAGLLKLPMTIVAPLTTILLIFWNFFATQWALRANLFRLGRRPPPDTVETKP